MTERNCPQQINCNLFQGKLKGLRKIKQDMKEKHKSEIEIFKNEGTTLIIREIRRIRKNHFINEA